MDTSSELNLTEIFRILKRRIRIFLILFVVVFCATLIVTLAMPPTYKASAKMIIQNETNLYPAGLIPNTAEDKVFLGTQKEIISSGSIINTALKDVQSKGFLKQADYDALKKKVNVGYINDSNLLEINVYHNNPQEAAEFANAIVTAFINYQTNVKLKLVDSSLSIVSQEAITLKKVVDDLKIKLQEFRDKEQLTFYQAQIPNYVSNILDLNKKNLLADVDIKRMKEELTKTRDAINSGQAQLFYPLMPNLSVQNTGENPTSSIATVPWMQDIKRKLSEAQADLSRLIIKYTENHPDIMGIRNQIASLQNNLDEELKKVLLTYVDYYNGYIRFLESQKKSNEMERVRSESELDKIAQNMDKAAAKQIEYNMLVKNYDTVQDIYSIFFKKQNELQAIKEQVSKAVLPNMRIFETASVPLKPVIPNVPLNLTVGICLGLLIGISGALTEEKREYVMKKPRVLTGLRAERRSMARVERVFVVTYESKEKPGEGRRYAATTENISGSGINIRLKEYMPKGTELSLEIHITDKDIIRMVGVVVWIAPAEVKDMFDAGLHFTKIEPEEREKLINYLYGENYLAKRA